MTATLIRVEIAKLRRLRLTWLLLLTTAANVLYCSSPLFSASARRYWNQPGGAWDAYLVQYVMGTALFTPIAIAIVASRVVDIEHAGNGWRLSSVIGVTRGALCRLKWVTLAPIVLALRVIEVAAVLALPALLGMPAVTNLGVWVRTAAVMVVTTLALLAAHLWLAARIESQLVGIGIAVLGGFLAMFSMLLPPVVALLTPYGSFAAVLPYTYSSSGIIAISPHYLPWGLWAAALLVGSWALTRRLDQEG